MRYRLDNYPVPEDVYYINDVSLIERVPYETVNEIMMAANGKIISEGGVLPNDNVRIYVPLDLNENGIMYHIYGLFDDLGDPTEENEMAYSVGVGKVINWLEIYDHIWIIKDVENIIQKGEVRHSRKGVELAKKIVKYLQEHEGITECFPYEEIERVNRMFGL